MAGNASSHPSFMCRGPFNREQVTCFNARYFTGSATNLADPYPMAYLVWSESWFCCWHFWLNLFRFPNNVGMELSFLGRRTLTLFNIFNVGRTTTFLNVIGMITSGRICVTLLKNFGWSGRTLSMILSFTTCWGWESSIGRGGMFEPLQQFQGCVWPWCLSLICCLVFWSWRRRYLKSHSTKSSSNKFF